MFEWDNRWEGHLSDRDISTVLPLTGLVDLSVMVAARSAQNCVPFKSSTEGPDFPCLVMAWRDAVLPCRTQHSACRWCTVAHPLQLIVVILTSFCNTELNRCLSFVLCFGERIRVNYVLLKVCLDNVKMVVMLSHHTVAFLFFMSGCFYLGVIVKYVQEWK